MVMGVAMGVMAMIMVMAMDMSAVGHRRCHGGVYRQGFSLQQRCNLRIGPLGRHL